VEALIAPHLGPLVDRMKDDLIWTAERFGQRQVRAYAKTLSKAITALSAGPSVAGAKTRDDIGNGVMTLLVARARRKGRHFIVFRRADLDQDELEVLRILHDALDLPNHFGGEG
jgi:toxin ParE1/3/4